MAEEGATLPELEGFDKHLEGLSVKYSSHGSQIDSKSFCSEFCELVERFCGVQGGPDPQLHVLEVALCYFFRASSFLPSHCDHVHYTLSSLALSVFELLLFYDPKEFSQGPVQHLTFTFQECHVALARHPNAYLQRLRTLIQDGGPWGSQVLRAVLCEGDVPQDQVDRFLSTEAPLFLELRVRYLQARGQGREAAALARHCAAANPSSRRRAFFLQVHLAWLCKMQGTEELHKEVCTLGGEEVLQVICGLERHEEAAVLLCLCRAALKHLLHTGSVSCLRPLVCVWGSLHRRQQTTRLELLQESRSLLHLATDGTAIFPFIRVLLEELGDPGLQFCVELCSRVLRSGLVSDDSARSLVYKTVASLLPQDLEVCRACALLVFFQERTLGAYRTVVRLYSLPDQEYHAEAAPVGNHVRFDLLQALKKDLFFDPEFWNVAAIRSNCQKLLNGEALQAAREEAPEESHSTKEATVRPLTHSPPPTNATDPYRSEAKKRHENGVAPRRTRHDRGNSALKKNNKHTARSQAPRESGEFLRRSFWQPSRTNDGLSSSTCHGEQRRITRFSEKNRPKRRIRTPRWLLEDSGTLEMNAHRKVKKLRRKQQQEEAQEKAQEKARPLVKRNSSALPKTSTKEKHLVKCDLGEKQSTTRHLKGLSLDYLRPASPAHVILELSLPDNELSDIFNDERNGLPPVLLYKASARVPHPPQSHKTVHLKRVVIRAADEVSLAQQLHCYARRNKHLAATPEVQSTASVVTRSSSQAPPTKGSAHLPRSKPLVEMKVTIASQVRTRAGQSQLLGEGHAKAASEGALPLENKICLAEHCSLAPEYMDIRTEQASTTKAVANTLLVTGGHSLTRSLENADHGVCHSTACKDSAPLQIGGVSDSVVIDAPAKVSDANVHIAGNDAVDGYCADEVFESMCHDGVMGRVSDTHGSHVEEDLHGLRLLSETVSALAPAAPQCVLEPSGEATEGQSLPAQQSPTLGNIPDFPPKTTVHPSSPCTEKSSCYLSEPNSEDEPVQEPKDGGDQTHAPLESESESHLEYRCTLCDKVFRGKRVAVHAMFHYRRDKCMFCGMLFNDDLLAMMHLSEHIDKLKKLRESEHKGQASDTPQRSEKLKTTSPLPLVRDQRRPRKSITTPASAVPAPSESRRLRSDSSVAKRSMSPLPSHKLNGHIKRSPARNRQPVPDRPGPPRPIEKEDKLVKMDNGPSAPHRPPKQTTKRPEAESVVATEKCCPVVGCHWHADLSRSPLPLLYHALEDHPQDDTPLELAFHISNSQCSVCLRVLWSFQHYRHHVERHRLTPRHPCLHQGCGARFKTGLEMRRHSRKHHPLQASCCVPGCSKLFICLWALNLHEREHYAIKDTKGAKAPGAEIRCHRKTECTRQGSGSAHAVATPMRGKGHLKAREQTTDVPSTEGTRVRSEVTTGVLGKGSSTLRRSQADSNSTVSHTLRKTNLRQRAKQMHLTSPPPLLTTSRRMGRRLENRQVKLNIIGHKTKNPHLPLTELSEIASSKKSSGKRKCGRVVEEKRSLHHKCTVVSTSQEQSAPFASTAQEQSAPNMASTAQEHSAFNLASAAQEHSAFNLASATQEHSAVNLASAAQEQSAFNLASAAQEQSVPVASTVQEQSAPNMASTVQEQSAPNMASTVQKQSAPTMASTVQEQSVPMAPTVQEQSVPMAPTVQEQSIPMAPTVQEQSASTVAPTVQEQSASTVASTGQEESSPMASTGQEESAPMASTAQEESAPIMVSTVQEQPASIIASTVQEQPVLTMASTVQEQPVPTMASTVQEQPVPTMASTVQEQPVPTMASTVQEQPVPTMASTVQEQPVPTMASTVQEQSAPTMASTVQEQSAPTMASTVQEQSAPTMASTVQEQSAPTMASTVQEQSAPTMASTVQEQSAPTMDSTVQEQSAPVASTVQERSAPNMASAAQEQSAPHTASAAKEQSAPHTASTVQEQLNKSQVSKKHKRISATPLTSVGKLEGKGRAAHVRSGPKTKETSTGNTSKSKCRTPSKITDTTVGKTTKVPLVTKTTKGPSVARTKKGPSVVKATKGPSVAKATKGPSVAMTTEGVQVANVSPTSEVERQGACNHVAAAVPVNGAAAGKRKATAEVPPEATLPSCRKTYFRAPPTAYLDERFTNMPKRRKHMSMFSSLPLQNPDPDPRPATRCPSCFVSFGRNEDLRAHLQDKKCSSMFGFDSDEDNS